MINGIPQAALPDVEGVASFFSAALRREVTASAARPIPDARLVMAGHYVNGAKALISGCFADRDLVAYAGAALSLVPADAAEESLAQAELDEVLVENFAEILNICSRLFQRDTSQRVTLSTVEDPATATSATSAAMLKNPVRRLDVELDIAGYGKGRMALALQPA
jgi:hypothetical protein